MQILTFLTTSVLAGISFARPTDTLLTRDVNGVLTRNSEGKSGGFFYMFWSDAFLTTDEIAPVAYRNMDDGRYSVEWSEGTGNFIAGKGWNATDADRLKSVTYRGTYSASGTSYLSLYGQMTTTSTRLNAEYYVIDNWNRFNPASEYATAATVESDGGVYDIHIGTRVAQGLEPSIRRIYSVRREKRTGGTITLRKHLDAWKGLGEKLASHRWSILAVEGYQSSGEADITVSGA